MQIHADCANLVLVGDDGNVYSIGSNKYVQLGNGVTSSATTVNVVAAKRPAGVKFVQAKTGNRNVMALGDNGQVYTWGANDFGQLGQGKDVASSFKQTVPKMIEMANISSVKLGSVPAKTFKTNEDGTFTAVSPKNTAGPVDITVEYQVGSNPRKFMKTYPKAFTYTKAASTTDPQDQEVPAGGSATFSVEIDGHPTPKVIWERSADNGKTRGEITKKIVTRSDNTKLTLDAAVDAHGHQFRAKVSNGIAATVVTKPATLSVVRSAPTVTDPADQSAAPGTVAVFTVTTTGAPKPSVSWERSTDQGETWASIDGATETADGSKLAVLADAKNNGARFRAIADNDTGEPAISAHATLAVRQEATTISDPADQAVEHGALAKFVVKVTGFPVPKVVWEHSTDQGKTWSGLTGAGTATADGSELSVAGSAQNDGSMFRAVASNSAGEPATSKPATLTLRHVAATITDPAPQTVAPGKQATFEVKTTGYPVPNVVWEQSTDKSATWTPVTDGVTATATGSKLTVTGTAQNTGTQFRATASNSAGDSVTSKPALLTVSAGPGEVSRIAGASRYETAANVSKAGLVQVWVTPHKSGRGRGPDAHHGLELDRGQPAKTHLSAFAMVGAFGPDHDR